MMQDLFCLPEATLLADVCISLLLALLLRKALMRHLSPRWEGGTQNSPQLKFKIMLSTDQLLIKTKRKGLGMLVFISAVLGSCLARRVTVWRPVKAI
jgi:hypothetical protein